MTKFFNPSDFTAPPSLRRDKQEGPSALDQPNGSGATKEFQDYVAKKLSKVIAK